MDDVRVEHAETPEAAAEPRPDREVDPAGFERPGRGRLRVALMALAVVAVIVVGSVLLGGPGEPARGPASGDPSADLEEALASGTPAYVLIHSLT